MANKTNPIGVRFNKDLLDEVKVSPQKALNIYEQLYLDKDKKVELPPESKEGNKNDERDLILKQIADIKSESCPPERNTTMGKKVWETDQQKRINYLLNKLL